MPSPFSSADLDWLPGVAYARLPKGAARLALEAVADQVFDREV